MTGAPGAAGAEARSGVPGPGAGDRPVEDSLLAWRAEFPTVEASLHFISHSLGAMPRGVDESLRRYAQAWKARGIRAWDESWMQVPTDVAALVERILNAEPGSVSLHPNVTLAHATALSALDFARPRNRLLCTAEDFPSVLYLIEGLARRGVDVVRVPARAGRRIEEADVVAAIDERTAVVALSQVLFRTSQLLDVAQVARRAREVGALTVVDAYQAVGTVPVDVQALGVDVLAGGSIKWMCGGPGTAFLYVSPRVAPRLEPTTVAVEADAHQAPVGRLVVGLERHAAAAGLLRLAEALRVDQDVAAQVRRRGVLAADRALERAERRERAVVLLLEEVVVDQHELEVGFAANRRLLDVQQLSHDCHVGATTFQQLQSPLAVDGQRASALRFGDDTVQALLQALLVLSILSPAFKQKDLKERLAQLLGLDPSTMTQGKMTYQLRRLRLHGFIERLPRKHRYRVTPFGLRLALFYTRTYVSVLRPGLSHIVSAQPPGDTRLRSHFDKTTEAIEQWCRDAKLAA